MYALPRVLFFLLNFINSSDLQYIQGDVAFDDDILVSLLEVDLGGYTGAQAA